MRVAQLSECNIKIRAYTFFGHLTSDRFGMTKIRFGMTSGNFFEIGESRFEWQDRLHSQSHSGTMEHLC